MSGELAVPDGPRRWSRSVLERGDARRDGARRGCQLAREVDRGCRAAYLMQNMAGSLVARRAGQFGVLEKTAFYERGLPSFRLLDRTPSRGTDFRLQSTYEDSFWSRDGVA